MRLSQHMLAWTPSTHQLPGAQVRDEGGQPRPQVCGRSQARRNVPAWVLLIGPLWHRVLPTQVSHDHMETSQGSRTFSFMIQVRDKSLQNVLSDPSNHVSRLATSHPGWGCQAGGGWLPEMGGGVPDTSATAGVGVCHPFMQYTHAHSCAQTHTLLSDSRPSLSRGA